MRQIVLANRIHTWIKNRLPKKYQAIVTFLVLTFYLVAHRDGSILKVWCRKNQLTDSERKRASPNQVQITVDWNRSLLLKKLPIFQVYHTFYRDAVLAVKVLPFGISWRPAGSA
jgi:hypothetical protein